MLKDFFSKANTPLPPGPSLTTAWDHSLFANIGKIFLDTPQQYFKRYGKLYRLPGFLKHAIDVIDPHAIEHIFVKKLQNYDKTHVFWYRLKQLTGDGLLTRPLETWQTHQQIIQKGFQKKYLEQYTLITFQQTQHLIQSLKTHAQKKQPLDLLNTMVTLTLKIISDCLSHHPISDQQCQTLHNIIQLGNYRVSHAIFSHPFWPTPGNLYFKWQRRKLDRFLQTCLAHRVEKKDDLLQILLDSPLSQQAILDEFKTLLITGHETLAIHLTWSLILLAQHPDSLNKLRAETQRVLGDKTPEFSDLAKLSYAKAIVQESLRLYPPLWCVFRTAKQADQINGCRIPKNSVIRLHTYALHRSPDFWEAPNTFKPERFLEKTPLKYTYLPFGVGARSCIGRHLALLESQLILSLLSQSFDFSILNKKPILPKPLITLQPNKVHMQFLMR